VEVDVIQTLKSACDSLTSKAIFTRRKLWKARRDRHLETKAIVKAHKLGKGRSKSVEKNED